MLTFWIIPWSFTCYMVFVFHFFLVSMCCGLLACEYIEMLACYQTVISCVIWTLLSAISLLISTHCGLLESEYSESWTFWFRPSCLIHFVLSFPPTFSCLNMLWITSGWVQWVTVLALLWHSSKNIILKPQIWALRIGIPQIISAANYTYMVTVHTTIQKITFVANSKILKLLHKKM